MLEGMTDPTPSVVHAPQVLARIASALPDAISAAFFLVVWLMPLRFGADMVSTAMLVMLIEFITVHASGMLGGVVLDPSQNRGKRLRTLLALSAMYGLFILMFVWVFRQWWPLFVFGWLLLGKFSRVLFGAATPDQDAAAQRALWGTSAAAYVLGVLITVMLPMPRLGVVPEVIPQLRLTGSGLWVDEPHRLLAFGFLYFTVLAIAKLFHLGGQERRWER